MNDVCYIISATVKISVALVLYRLVERVYNTIRWILLIDIFTCAVFNTVTTIILALGCMEGTPYTFSEGVCENTNYAQEASYVIWDVFHVVIPVAILWNIQMGWMVKSGVLGLFSVGLLYVPPFTGHISTSRPLSPPFFSRHCSGLPNTRTDKVETARAAVTTMLRLRNYVEYFNPTSTTTMQHIWYTGVTWATTEHGLSLFAASILALKPVVHVVSRSWSSLSSSLLSSNRKRTSGSGASGRIFKNSDWFFTPDGTELGNIGVQTEISVDAKSKAQDRLQEPVFAATAYNGSHESHKRLVEGSKAVLDAKTSV